MKGHFVVQFKKILKFNLADGLEDIKKMLNERVKKKRKSTQKMEGKEIAFFLKYFPFKGKTGVRGTGAFAGQ